VSPRASVDDVEKYNILLTLLGIELRLLGRSASRKSLYRLRVIQKDVAKQHKSS
jgi:hypothetical protein